MKKNKILLLAICIMTLLSVTNVHAYGKTYKKLEPEVITIDVNKERREKEEQERKTAVTIALGVSAVSFLVFIGTTCILIKSKKEQKIK